MATTPQPPPAGPAPSPASPPVGGRTNHNGLNPAAPQSPDKTRHDTGLFNYPPLSPDRPASAPAAVLGGGRNGGGYREEEQQQQQEQEAAAAAVAGAVAAAHTEAEELLESYLADLYEVGVGGVWGAWGFGVGLG